ncbi:MAG TPA: transglutaminase family protein [Chitinophagaceae bacterium]|jgi:transglutaminase-like putative cysteine protease|nr:transglutaminase family protein [Chitinophagaceae bacterium]
MPLFKIQHITTYEYDRLIQESVNEIKIFPFLSPEQEILQHELVITGNPDVQIFFDYWGNKTGIFNLLPPHQELAINSRLMVRTTGSDDLRINFVSVFNELPGEVGGHLKMLELSRPDYIKSQAQIREIAQWMHPADDSVAIAIKNCSDYIFREFSYISGITNVETTIDEILEQKAGVCQDFAHIMLQILRTLKIPSRYVSGYICPHKSGLRGEGATHAWVEAWVPRFGWAGIDPTNNVWVTNTHVKLATGRDFADCSPVKGAFKGPANQHLTVFVSVDYEDGQVIEELNKVDMKRENTAVDSPHFSPAAQQ